MDAREKCAFRTDRIGKVFIAVVHGTLQSAGRDSDSSLRKQRASGGMKRAAVYLRVSTIDQNPEMQALGDY
jgi:hypothetical protein